MEESLFTGSGYMKWMEEVNKEEGRYISTLAFDDYMNFFEKNPKKEVRPTCVYLRDMFDHFGKNENGSYKLFSRHCGKTSFSIFDFTPFSIKFKMLGEKINRAAFTKFLLINPCRWGLL